MKCTTVLVSHLAAMLDLTSMRRGVEPNTPRPKEEEVEDEDEDEDKLSLLLFFPGWLLGVILLMSLLFTFLLACFSCWLVPAYFWPKTSEFSSRPS